MKIKSRPLYRIGQNIVTIYDTSIVWKITGIDRVGNEWTYLCSAPFAGQVRILEKDVELTTRQQKVY